MSGKIAFQGELGAYSHEACIATRPPSELFARLAPWIGAVVGVALLQGQLEQRTAQLEAMGARAALHKDIEFAYPTQRFFARPAEKDDSPL